MTNTKPIRFLMLGGFLGAGKTTALLRLAQQYTEQGLRVGIITNDQAEGLVDTLSFREAGFTTEEIPSGCFCCHFEKLIEASGRLADGLEPDIILAEPVGSCTDLVNAVITPLKKLYTDRFEVAPYATLLDPHRALDALSASGPTGFSKKITYLYKMQQNEADIVAINKSDRLDGATRERITTLVEQNFPRARHVFVSALTGDGFDSLLALLSEESEAGRHPAMVDYGQYTEAEVALGWLNSRVALASSAGPFDGNALLATFADTVRSALVAAGAEIAHFKMRLIDEAEREAALHMTRNDEAPMLTRRFNEPVSRATLVINLRAEGAPDTLERCVATALEQSGAQAGVTWEVVRSEAFAPSPPVPPPPERNEVRL